jgi:GLPGLI family protein
MKRCPVIILLSLFLLVAICSVCRAQKKISELTIAYDYAISSGDHKTKSGNTIINAVYTIYIKGNLSSSEIVSPLFSSKTIYDNITGSAVVLKEVSGQKLLIRMTADNWQEKNKPYQSISFNNTGETKVIGGYKCIKAVAKIKDGFTISVYYTRDLIPDNKDYDPQFKNLDGLPLEFELTKAESVIKYSLSSINLSPVPASKFDIPKTGYREMTFDESKKLGTGGK